MKKILLFIGWLLCHWFFPCLGQACLPCETTLGFEDTAQRADLIIVGRKVGGYPPLDLDPRIHGPDWIRVEILEILKGDTEAGTIKVNSYNGMCGYGIIINDENQYVIFLERSRPRAVDYDAVNNGCGVKTYPVKDGRVEYQQEALPMDIFKLMLQKAIERTEAGHRPPEGR